MANSITQATFTTSPIVNNVSKALKWEGDKATNEQNGWIANVTYPTDDYAGLNVRVRLPMSVTAAQIDEIMRQKAATPKTFVQFDNLEFSVYSDRRSGEAKFAARATAIRLADNKGIMTGGEKI
jgi:hypothetical protein